MDEILEKKFILGNVEHQQIRVIEIPKKKR